MPKKKKGKKQIPFVEGLNASEILEIPLEEINEDDRTFQYRLTTDVRDIKNSLITEGQKEPIELMGSKPHRIIDGFRRVKAIRAMGWSVVKAIVHRGISDEDAQKIAFIKNVVRKNLSPMDKANAIFHAKHRDMRSQDLQEYFGLSEKQLKRYESLIEFSPQIQNILEKGEISMAHAKVLSDFKIKDPVKWVKKTDKEGLSAIQLKKELKKASGVKSSGRTKLYMKREKDGLRMYPFTIGKDSPKAEKDRVLKLLQEAIEVLKS